MLNVRTHETIKSINFVSARIKQRLQYSHNGCVEFFSCLPQPASLKHSWIVRLPFRHSPKAFSTSAHLPVRRVRKRPGDEDEDDDDDHPVFAIETSAEKEERQAKDQESLEKEARKRRDFARRLDSLIADSSRHGFGLEPPTLHEAQANQTRCWAVARAQGQQQWRHEFLKLEHSILSSIASIQDLKARVRRDVELARDGDRLEERHWIAWQKHHYTRLAAFETQYLAIVRNTTRLQAELNRIRFTVAWRKWREDDLGFRSQQALAAYEEIKAATGDHTELTEAVVAYTNIRNDFQALFTPKVLLYMENRAPTLFTQVQLREIWRHMMVSSDTVQSMGHVYRTLNLSSQIDLRFPHVHTSQVIGEIHKHHVYKLIQEFKHAMNSVDYILSCTSEQGDQSRYARWWKMRHMLEEASIAAAKWGKQADKYICGGIILGDFRPCRLPTAHRMIKAQRYRAAQPFENYNLQLRSDVLARAKEYEEDRSLSPSFQKARSDYFRAQRDQQRDFLHQYASWYILLTARLLASDEPRNLISTQWIQREHLKDSKATSSAPQTLRQRRARAHIEAPPAQESASWVSSPSPPKEDSSTIRTTEHSSQSSWLNTAKAIIGLQPWKMSGSSQEPGTALSDKRVGSADVQEAQRRRDPSTKPKSSGKEPGKLKSSASKSRPIDAKVVSATVRDGKSKKNRSQSLITSQKSPSFDTRKLLTRSKKLAEQKRSSQRDPGSNTHQIFTRSKKLAEKKK